MKNVITVKVQEIDDRNDGDKTEIDNKMNNIDRKYVGNKCVNYLTLDPVILPNYAVLKKGYQRAAILSSSKIGLIASRLQLDAEDMTSSIDEDENALTDISEPEAERSTKNLNLKSSKTDIDRDGNEKVSGIVNESDSDSNSRLSIYEVVIHSGEAFLKEKRIDISLENSAESTIPKIIDFSTGWQHSILLLEK